MERPTPAQIQHIIDQAQHERSRVMGELIARGMHAVGHMLHSAYRAAAEAAAMRNARTPQHLQLKLRQHGGALH